MGSTTEPPGDSEPAILIGNWSPMPEHYTMTWGQAGWTHYLRFEPETPRFDLPPIIYVHGWLGSADWRELLRRHENLWVLAPLLNAGYTVYLPYHGPSWGTNETWPGTAGTGVQAIDDMRDTMFWDGYGEQPARLMTMSSGSIDAWNWAWRHPDEVHAVFSMDPQWDLRHLREHDPILVPSMDVVFQTAADQDDHDPALNLDAMADVGPRITVWASRDDEGLRWDLFSEFCDAIGLQLMPSSPPGEFGGFHGQSTFTIWFDDDVVVEALR